MIGLRSKITQKVLNYLMLHEGSALYINEMSRHLGVDRGNLVRKLQELEAEGILRSEWKGNQRYYSLNPSFPLLQEYKKIILKTVGFEGALREALLSVKGIRHAMLFGSYAADAMDLSSDLDLLVIGKQNTLDLYRAVMKLQKSVKRDINVISMDAAEYETKRKKDPFLKSVLHKKRINIV